MREYDWNGRRYQIAEEDLKNYPGAVPVKLAGKPKNKARKPGGEKKEK